MNPPMGLVSSEFVPMNLIRIASETARATSSAIRRAIEDTLGFSEDLGKFHVADLLAVARPSGHRIVENDFQANGFPAEGRSYLHFWNVEKLTCCQSNCLGNRSGDPVSGFGEIFRTMPYVIGWIDPNVSSDPNLKNVSVKGVS
jgi:hypothetical protein